jgi:Protein of unknown function (DUF3443)
MRESARGILVLILFGVLVGCGGGSTTTTPAPGPVTPPSGSNVQPITVNFGPATSVGVNIVNLPLTSVTLCVPGSTTNCQTIDGILVDTGSTGFRVLSSALTLTLPQQNDSSSHPIAECFPFVSSTIWGSVKTADLSITGEKASSLPIQVIGDPNFPVIPAACDMFGPPQDDLATFGANGLLGIGVFAQDCGDGCEASGASNFGLYYTCPSSGCEVTTESLAEQLQQPVTLFAADNNGALVELPSVSAPEASVTGSLIFGIGTQSNNGLGSATVFAEDTTFGLFSTTFNGQTFSDSTLLDTGSDGIFFLDSETTGIPACTDIPELYCPTSTKNLTAINTGMNGATGNVSFSVGNADSLISNVNNAAIPNLAGPDPAFFDWGLPFFFGRNVFTAIDGRSTPGGTGPYQAY